jgi:site-specific DNA recombinase
MAKVLGALRLSRDSDESTSIARQREQITLWAKLDGHEVIGFTEDTDVSGSVSPWKRPGLGPWLTDPVKVGSWDILVSAKLDRITRSVADFSALLAWCGEHRKMYASVAEKFDLSTPGGRMVATVMAAFAQFERERIGERHTESRAKMRELGHWAGRAPYGYDAVSNGNGMRLVQDPATAPVAKRMVDEFTTGASFGQVARRLNGDGVPTFTGGQWSALTVRSVLVNPAIGGQGWHRPKLDDGKRAAPVLIRDSDGEPVMFTDEPILDSDEFDRLRQALKAREQPHGARVGGHQLLRVAYCRACSEGRDDRSAPLYGNVMKGRAHGYYRCPKCGVRVRDDRMEAAVEHYVLKSAGSRELRRKTVIPGDDHAADIRKAERDLEAMRGLSTHSDTIRAAVTELEDQLAKLRQAPHEPDRVEWVPRSACPRVNLASSVRTNSQRCGARRRTRAGETRPVSPSEGRRAFVVSPASF